MKKKPFVSIAVFTMLLLPLIVKAGTSPQVDPNAIEISLPCPAIGQKPHYIVSTEYTELYDEMWVNETDYKEMKSTDVFEQGKNYSYHYGYKMKEMYKDKYLDVFGMDYIDSCQYAVGGTAGGDEYSSGGMGYHMGDRNSYQWEEKEKAILDINSPIKGGNPPYARSNMKYSILDEKWINTTDNKEMKSTDVFEENKKYKYIVTYSTFYDSSKLLSSFESNKYYLGNSYNYIDSITQESQMAYFYFGSKNDLLIEGTATVSNNNTPRVGYPLALPEITIDAPTTIFNSYWRVVTDENPYGQWVADPSKEIVEAGKTYIYGVNINLEPGYNFSENFEFINNNKTYNFVKDFTSFTGKYNDPDNTRTGLTYEATYTVLEEGQTIAINGNTDIIYPGWGRSLTAYPANEYNETITWKSSDENVVIVDDNGQFWAQNPGTATITATNLKGDSASVTITVGTPVEQVTLNKTSLTLYEGESEQLTADITPENPTTKELNWGIVWEEGYDYSNPIVQVSNDGTITALRAGTVTVQAYALAGGVTATCEVTVLEPELTEYNIDVDVPAPTLNGHPTHGNKTYGTWYNITDHKEMESTDVFEVNKKYKLIIEELYETYAYLGYKYNIGNLDKAQYYSSTSVIDEQFEDQVSYIWNTKVTIEIDFYFRSDDPNYLINTGDVVIIDKNNLENNNFNSLNPNCMETKIKSVSEDWEDMSGNAPTSFVDDNYYIYTLTIYAGSKYRFSEEFTVDNRNSRDHLLQEAIEVYDDYAIYKALYKKDKSIDGVNVPGPIVGMKPMYGNDTNDYEFIQQVWVNLSDKKIMTENDIFEESKLYSYTIVVNKYVMFPNDFISREKYYIGGGATGTDDFTQASADFYTGSNCPTYNNEYAYLDIDSPTLGQNYPSARNNEKYEIVEEKWYNVTDDKEMKSTDVFETNKEYEYRLKYRTAYSASNIFQAFKNNEYYLGEKHKLLGPGLVGEATASFYFGNKSDLKVETGQIVLNNFNQPEVGNTMENPTI